MKIEIDQSGKIEDTAKPTVLALSNDQKFTLILSALDKKLLQNLFREFFHKKRIFVYQVFSALLFVLITSAKIKKGVTIDREYPTKESLITRYCLEMCRQKNIREFTLNFGHVGKSSSAHSLAYKTFKGKLRPNKKISFEEVLELLFTSKKKIGYPAIDGTEGS